MDECTADHGRWSRTSGKRTCRLEDILLAELRVVVVEFLCVILDLDEGWEKEDEEQVDRKDRRASAEAERCREGEDTAE